MIKIEITEKELEYIQTALAFTSCTQTCWKGNDKDKLKLATLAEKFNTKFNISPSDKTYLFDSENNEDPHTFLILEKFTNVKRR